jgi:hypothetical protein
VDLHRLDASDLIPSSDQSPPESPSPGNAPESQPAAPPPTRKSITDWYRKQGREWVRNVGKFAFDVARYYWGIRQLLWEYIAGFLPDLASESNRLRTVRLNPDESYALAEFGPEGWKVSVPGRCVVCGERTQDSPVDETKLVENAARAFWFPATSLVLGLTVGWFLFGRWLATLSLPLGLAAGYLMRSKVPVLLRLVRCHEHAMRLNIPQVLAWGNTLVLRFGHKTVRKVFLYGESMDYTVPQPDAASADSFVPGGQPESAHVPETIPLADSPDPANSQITHDLPPAFGEEDETK